MASINQLISEIAHSVQQADSIPVRRAIRLGIIHARNELIRQSYSNNHLLDKSLQQRFKCTLIDCPDSDLEGIDKIRDIIKIKRSKQRVPKPTRLCNGLPFHSVRTAGVEHPIEVAFTKEAVSQFYGYLPGMPCLPTYDYINGYLYINGSRNQEYNNLRAVIIEGVFEYPFEITEEHFDGNTTYNDDDEFIISEDMIGSIKKLVLETFNPQIVRQTNEIPNPNLVK